MSIQKNGAEAAIDTHQPQQEIQDTGLPVIVLVTSTMVPETLATNTDLEHLSGRFDLQLASTPTRALCLSRKLQSAGNRVVLLLSDMLTSGTEVFLFISTFSQDWPDAGFHLIDSMEGRVIFSEPNGPESDRSPSIQIESNGREPLDSRLVSMMVERYFPST